MCRTGRLRASTWSGPSGRLTDFTVPHALLALCTVGRAEIRIRGSGPERRPVSVPGRLFVLGRGYELESVSWSGTCELLCVEVCSWRRGVLKEPADDLSEVALAPQFAISEPQLAALILNMRAEIEAGCPAGRRLAWAAVPSVPVPMPWITATGQLR